MTQFSVYRRVEDLIDLLIPDVMDAGGTALAESYTINTATNWDGVFAPVAELTNIGRGFGTKTDTVTNVMMDLAGGGAVIKNKTRVLIRPSDLGWNDFDVRFLTVTANFRAPVLPETGDIRMVLTADQYRLPNSSLVLSGTVAAPTVIVLPRVCCDAVVAVSTGSVQVQFGTGPGSVSVTPTANYIQPRAQFSKITLGGAGVCSVSMALNVSR